MFGNVPERLSAQDLGQVVASQRLSRPVDDNVPIALKSDKRLLIEGLFSAIRSQAILVA
jgi:hypothetical protein